MKLVSLACLLLAGMPALGLRADDGYRLWLRYDEVEDSAQRDRYREQLRSVTFALTAADPFGTLDVATAELKRGLGGLIGIVPEIHREDTPRHSDLGSEGYALRTRGAGVVIAANSPAGILHGAFALLRHLQARRPADAFTHSSVPRVRHRLLNHWDNLDGTIERGYAGRSLWQWDELPGRIDPRYHDYARANASLGLNGTVLTNVNANARVLTPAHLARVAALADTFRPYGIRVYLTARFSTPVEIGGLATADPHAPEVQDWWRAKAAAIYRLIPDFGGFLVKANSEGQPGPQNYGRSHADGANLLADAVAPHGGIVIWRAFVYDDAVPDDRHKQAYNEFRPLDGTFRPNVVVQVKNGAIDFMPREPFHPLFGAMPLTPLGLELQITQEYLGGSSQLAFLAPMWREVLDAATHRPRSDTTVARIVDGTAFDHRETVIAGVANTGSDRNWSGNHLAPANWYAFGRLAWDHQIPAGQIADEWIRLTFGTNPTVLETMKPMLLASHQAVVNYSMPLGLHHIMARDHHQGPGPWVAGGRADWTSVYYHQADRQGIGFDRTRTGSDALAQYAPPVAQKWGDPATCPDEFLLWFHHLPWDYRMRSGRILWDELCLRYQAGVDAVRAWQRAWGQLGGTVDPERHREIAALLHRQEREARIWRDACILYFATFSRRPIPAGVEPPEHPLEYYQSLDEPFGAEPLGGR